MPFCGAAVAGLGGLGARCLGRVVVCVFEGFSIASGVFVAVFVASVCVLSSPEVAIVRESESSVGEGAKVTPLTFFTPVELDFLSVFPEAVGVELEVPVMEAVVFARVFAESLGAGPPVLCNLEFVDFDKVDVAFAEAPVAGLEPAVSWDGPVDASSVDSREGLVDFRETVVF